MNKTLITVALLLGALGTVQAAGNANAGKSKSATCAACHGADGNSVNPIWPKLAGQHASYIEQQLAAFKGGARVNATMSPMAMPLSEQDMADLAAYFSSQQSHPAVGDPANEQIVLGKQIYQAGIADKGVAACMACHGPSGSGNPAAKFPRLSGQHAAYLESTLKGFRSGERANDPNRMMRDIAAKMSDAEMSAVAAYIGALK